MGRESDQILHVECLYGNPMAKNFLPNRILFSL